MKFAPKVDEDNSLPLELEISLDEFRAVLPDWIMWVSTGRKFLPRKGGLRDQPEHVMNVILYIDMLFEKIVAQVLEQIRSKV
jgi:hypothetical protein